MKIDKCDQCAHCTQTCDSFGNYVSHFCHVKQVNIKGFGDKTYLCEDCKEFVRKDIK